MTWSAWLALLTVLVSLAGYAGRYSWLLDLCSHFRAPLLVMQLGLCVYLAVSGEAPFLLGMLGAGLILNFQSIRRFYGRTTPVDWAPKDGPTLKLLHMNLWKLNRWHRRVADYIRKTQPDVISLVEYTLPWQRGLAATGVLADYPYFLFHVQDKTVVALYSRHPLTNLPLPENTQLSCPAILSQLTLQGATLNLVAMHTATPEMWRGAREQRQQFDQIATLLASLEGPIVVVGDLNTTPWAYPFRRFLAQTGLVNTLGRGTGIQPTWPLYLGIPWLPLDHVLVSPGVARLARHTGGFIGSDHLPLHLTLGIPITTEGQGTPESMESGAVRGGV